MLRYLDVPVTMRASKHAAADDTCIEYVRVVDPLALAQTLYDTNPELLYGTLSKEARRTFWTRSVLH